MIIRVFDARVRPGSEQDFMAGERELLGRTDVEGLLSVSIGRRFGSGQMHVITLSMWESQEALERFAGADIHRPVFLSGREHHVERWRLRHYDAVDAPELDAVRLDEDGQGLAEYALILALIAIVSIVALIVLGNQVGTILSTVGGSI